MFIKCEVKPRWEYVTILWFLLLICAVQVSNSCNSLTRYTCQNGICISRARVCDGHWDCEEGEDEAFCGGIVRCLERNEKLAELNGYICRKNCTVSSDCKASNKICICDDECGLSCLNPESQCDDQPPKIANSTKYFGQRRNNFSKPITIPWYGPFIFGDVIKYECKTGMQLVGPLPRCNGKRRWSSEIPICTVPRRSSGKSFARINANSIKGFVIYFLFDLSESSLKRPRELKMEFEFAKRLVERMKSFKGYANFGIVVFASSSIIVLDITDNIRFRPKPDRIIEILDDVYNKAISHFYVREAGRRTNIAFALEKIKLSIAFFKSMSVVDIESHIFIFTDGRQTEGGDPVEIRRNVENEFVGSEFYSVTACRSSHSDQEEQVRLASRTENYVYIENAYQLSTYLDQVTNLTIDFAKCGQAGNVEAISNQATPLRIRRSVNAENANEGAWPWQALITRYGTTPEQVLHDENMLGGGSILNRHWILTAAHIFKYFEKSSEWMNELVISVGVLKRPDFDESMISSIQMYSMTDYIEHENFDRRSLLNDVALVKVGLKYNSWMMKEMENVDGIEYGYYVRPVCLPCQSTCITEKLLRPYINDRMSPEEKCLEEEKLLLTRDAKVVATGYGHRDKVEDGFTRIRGNFPKKLQQALLRIKSESECREGADIINDEAEEQIVRYSDKIICCGSGDPRKAIDTCAGDEGGPLVREVRDRNTGESCWIQIGIISFGWGCGREDIPGYYTNVAKYVSWIGEKMQQSDAKP